MLARRFVMSSPLIEIADVAKTFRIGGRHLPFTHSTFLRAVDGVSFTLNPGKTVSVVGESGSGKTTLANLVLRIEEPTNGRITFEGRDIWRLDSRSLKAYRGLVQAVLQDPTSSLNPRMLIRDIIAEPLIVAGDMSRAAIRRRVSELIELVGLDSEMATSYPHEFSGGQRQRIAIARALAPRPRLIVLDEPVSSLDVSIAAQITNLLKDLQSQLGVAYLLIAHNLATVRYLSDYVLVMYLGRVVESGDVDAVFDAPAHPYTRALLASSRPDWTPSDRERRLLLEGDILAPTTPTAQCRFHPRCPLAIDRCRQEAPLLRALSNDEHHGACHLA
jgi:oligopeptide/dipeptide ABC transporter ATP-binding protein